MTKQNSKNFKNLVEEAENGTSVEITAETIQIKNLITIKSALSIKRADGNSVKPTIKCEGSDAGIEIR